MISENSIKLMLYNCATYYHNGSLKTIKLDDGSIIHYDEDGHLKYIQLSLNTTKSLQQKN